MLLFDGISLILTSVIATMATMAFKHKTDQKIIDGDELEINKEINKSKVLFQSDSNDIISLMVNNVSELREYYVISKRQANRAFSSTLIVCILGFIIFIVGIAASIFSDEKIIAYTTLSGSIIEIISGLFFVLYRNTLNQLNLYHERLGSTEKYLTAMQLAEKVSPEKKDELFKYIIEVVLIDNSNITRTCNSDK